MKYRPLMILGSGSDVGKSLIVAGLCRIFRQEGMRVAPFKAQNMALNSFITPEGGEMGRAQVVQAQAAGLAPHVDMNPILLKPSSERGLPGDRPRPGLRQLLGPGILPAQTAAHPQGDGELPPPEPRDYELIILEGAGSAVELNLKKNDLVNFSMAKKAGAAVLLVADIDRGGVFAATIGSFHLLTPRSGGCWPASSSTSSGGTRPCSRKGNGSSSAAPGGRSWGCCPTPRTWPSPRKTASPWGAKGRRRAPGRQSGKSLRIGVVRLPHISNYTDFDPLEQEAGVSLATWTSATAWMEWTCSSCPGPRTPSATSSISRRPGCFSRFRPTPGAAAAWWAFAAVTRLWARRSGTPWGWKGPPRTEVGLGLLPVVTTMAGAKTTTQVQARALQGRTAGR